MRIGMQPYESQPWTDEQVTELRALRADGWSFSHIAEYMGRTKMGVRSKAEKLGMARRHRLWTPEEVETMMRMHQDGETYTVIARALDRTPKSVEERFRVENAINGVSYPSRAWTAREDKIIRQMRAAGYTYREIGETLKRATGSVGNRAGVIGCRSRGFSRDAGRPANIVVARAAPPPCGDFDRPETLPAASAELARRVMALGGYQSATTRGTGRIVEKVAFDRYAPAVGVYGSSLA